MEISFKKDPKGPDGEHSSPSCNKFNFFSSFFPNLRNIKNMDKFINNDIYFEFEKFDIDNDINGFNKLYDMGYLECMKEHSKLTGDVFKWTNFKDWLLDINQ
jgi:hypothetical protein